MKNFRGIRVILGGWLFDWAASGNAVSYSFQYLYGGKEFNSLKGINLYDFHARTYAPDLARFMQPDPLATENHGVSPYIFCNL